MFVPQNEVKRDSPPYIKIDKNPLFRNRFFYSRSLPRNFQTLNLFLPCSAASLLAFVLEANDRAGPGTTAAVGAWDFPFLAIPRGFCYHFLMEAFYIQWHITNFCSLRCRHCYQDDFSKGADLSLARLVQVAENFLGAVAGWGRQACIHLTGGEPLLLPNLFPLLRHLNRHPATAELGIITNGLLLDASRLQKLDAFPKLRKLKISLDGPEPETNDVIRAPGAFQRVRQNLFSLPRDGRFEVLLMFTAMRRNASRFLPFIHFARQAGVDGVILERFIPWGKGRGMTEGVLSPQEWRRLVLSLYGFFGLELEENEVSPYQAFQVGFQAPEPELMGAPCVLGTDGLCIMPEGTVFPCRRFPLPIGNLLVDSLESIWKKSEILEKVRRKDLLKGKCGICRIENCTGCRSLAYALTGDFLAEDPHCWHSPHGETG